MPLIKLITKATLSAFALALLCYSSIASARFLSADPMSVSEHVQRYQDNLRRPAASAWHPPLEINPYVAVANNPLRWIDSTGFNIDVCFYPSGITHVGFGIVGESGTFGFYPSVPSPIAIGEVRKDRQDKPRECKQIFSSEDQDKCMINCRTKRINNPGIYHIGARQCTSFVRDCMRECGISTGIDPGGDRWQGPRPDRFYEKLPGIGVQFQ